MRGVSRQEFEEYFRSLSNYSYEKRFYGADWIVELGDEKLCSICSIELVSVEIVFIAPKESLGDLLANFRSKFMRAGG